MVGGSQTLVNVKSDSTVEGSREIERERIFSSKFEAIEHWLPFVTEYGPIQTSRGSIGINVRSNFGSNSEIWMGRSGAD
jgi:hypothetical protein